MKSNFKQNLYSYMKITLKYLLNACKIKGLHSILFTIQRVSAQQRWQLTLLPPPPTPNKMFIQEGILKSGLEDA